MSMLVLSSINTKKDLYHSLHQIMLLFLFYLVVYGPDLRVVWLFH